MAMFSSARLVRFAKFALLIGMVGAHVTLLTFTFSHYLIRRELEQAAVAADEPPLDVLRFRIQAALAAGERATELRCIQRDMIALYRVLSHPYRREMGEIYAAMLPIRTKVSEWVRRQTLLDQNATEAKLNDTWGLAIGHELVFQAIATPVQQEETTRAFLAEQERQFRIVLDEAANEPARRLRATLDRLVGVELGALGAAPTAAQINAVLNTRMRFVDGALFERLAIDRLESAVRRIRAQMSELQLTNTQSLDILIRLAASDRALLGEDAPNSLHTQITAVFGVTREDGRTLAQLPCDTGIGRAFDRLHAEVGEEVARLAASPGFEGRAVGERAADIARTVDAVVARQMRDVVRSLPSTQPERASIGLAGLWDSASNAALGRFVIMPTAAQTLIVCMLFGSLGALCFQGLKLSGIGVFERGDATFAEIVTSMVLGMAAAMVIYLLALVSVLIVGDGRGQAASIGVGAGFVALLGFISGFLNNDAFARIRRFGLSVFESDGRPGAASLPAADVELARLLRDRKLMRMATLVEARGVGPLLAPRQAFTVFVEKDAAFAKMPLGRWEALIDPGDARELGLWLLAERVVNDASLAIVDLDGRSLSPPEGGLEPPIGQPIAAATGASESRPVVTISGTRRAMEEEFAFRKGRFVVLGPAVVTP